MNLSIDTQTVVLVEKALGNSRFIVKTLDGGFELTCIVPGRFKSPKKKQHNFIRVGLFLNVLITSTDSCEYISILHKPPPTPQTHDDVFLDVQPQNIPIIPDNIDSIDDSLDFDNI